ncbi:DUF192 domain-containing protein [Caldinitratiruptor microaerophilus]|uniref:DUF192 domain-containing protein n=1 Tax=Caldinitratiruptor microaerophilus TaxID=671077 RepID=A0AA35G8B0_9FIRM|nr:DUF192 domain-containing protein [Caldinitratiruptor microaerophilus]BDG60243.1 hypothetical protein caldi_13330 [Caldinitratiruptor microaerophilus]
MSRLTRRVPPAVRVRNDTRGAVLAERAAVADTFWRRLRGLMGRTALRDGEGLVIRPCAGVHGFFMRIPVDVLLVGPDGRILRALTPLRPWSPGGLVPGARFAVELPAGTVARTATRPGDRIVLEPVS